MVVTPHDIVKVSQTVQESLVTDFPTWAKLAWWLSPFHVVRRAPMIDEKIPIGIRGQTRSERFGIDIPQDWIASIITPQSLVEQKCWQTWQRSSDFPDIAKILNQLSCELMDYSWGIGGSLGYELTTSLPTIRETSDIDVILYQSTALPHKECKQIIERISGSPILIDIQVQNQKGAFHLQEYVQNPDTSILLKTADGPILTKDIWD